jgi:hypothetical protein
MTGSPDDESGENKKLPKRASDIQNRYLPTSAAPGTSGSSPERPHVGDTPYDIRAARRARLATIARRRVG